MREGKEVVGVSEEKPKTVNVGLRIPAELKERIDRLARQEDRSFSYQAINLLKFALDQRGKQAPL
jgi:predicted transcriptional regulator